MTTIGVFGGTFNPVHFGHLRSALELKQELKLEQVRMIPCSKPPHRDQPTISAEHRLNMLTLALEDANIGGLIPDDRELKRPELSYTVDTLLSLKADFPEKSHMLFVGIDAFAGFTTWHRWELILELANLVVITRPGAELTDAGLRLLDEREVESFDGVAEKHCGYIVQKRLTQLDISSTAIRLCFERQQDPAFLLPAVVMRYIREHKLYGKSEISKQ